MRVNYKLAGAAFGALALCAVNGAANADSITVPGLSAGLAIGAPLPQGLFFLDNFSYGPYRKISYNSEVIINVPDLVWSTPWTLFGGRIEAYGGVPSVSVKASNFPVHGANLVESFVYNPLGVVGAAWDLGNGFGFSEFVGGYMPVSNIFEQNFWTFNERVALSYTADGWNLTAHLIFGLTGYDIATGLKTHPDYLNLDLTATKTFGKWTFGAVGFGSTDVSGISNPYPYTTSYARQGQFALGAFVGYNFGPLDLQTYLTRDIASHNYVNPEGDKVYETRFWIRVIAPLYTPPAPASAVVAKY